MLSTPKVSIVLPTYNGSRWLAQSIESVLSQTYTNIELIIVDDASSDSTPEIIKKYQNLDKRIRLITHQTNKKLPQSLNDGFSVADGELYTWTSDDNIYKKNAIEFMVYFFYKNDDVALICCNYDLIDETGKIIGVSFDYLGERNMNHLLCHNNVGACFMYKASSAHLVGEYDCNMFLAEDYDYWLRISSIGKIKYLDENLYQYRIHRGSLSNNFNIKKAYLKVVYKNIRRLANNLKLSDFQLERLIYSLKIKISIANQSFFKLKKKDDVLIYTFLGIKFKTKCCNKF